MFRYSSAVFVCLAALAAFCGAAGADDAWVKKPTNPSSFLGYSFIISQGFGSGDVSATITNKKFYEVIAWNPESATSVRASYELFTTNSYTEGTLLHAVAESEPETGVLKLTVTAHQSYYAESEGVSTTTSTTAQDKTTLTFSLPYAGDYLIISNALIAHTTASPSANRYVEARTLVDSAVKNRVLHYTLNSSSTWHPYTNHVVMTGMAAGSHTLKIDYRASNSVDTAKIQKARIIAVELAGVSNTAMTDETTSTTSSTSYATLLTLTFTPVTAGDYLIVCTADVGFNDTLNRGFFRTTQSISGVDTDQGEMVLRPPVDTMFYYSYANFRVVNLAASSQTFKFQYKTSNSSWTAKAKNGRLTAVRLSTILPGGSNNAYGESETESTTTSTSLQTKLTTSVTPNASRDYYALGCAYRKISDGSNNALDHVGRLEADSVDQGEAYFRPTYGLEYWSTLTGRKFSWNTSSHSGVLNYRTSSSSYTARIKHARILLLPLK